MYSRRSLRYLLEARGALFAPESCGARRRARRRVCTPGGACNTYWKPGGALFAPESCGARRRARRRVCTPGGACNTYWKPGGFVRSGELWRPEACPEACVYSRRSLRYLLEARGALFAPESCGARRRARRRVCTPGGACDTYWKPGGLCSLRRAVAPGGVPGGVCVLPEELAILTGSPGGFVRSGELWRPEACPEACVYSRRSLQYLLEARGALFAPESCGARRRARRRVCTPGGACDTYWKPGGLCSLRRAVAPGGVPGGVCVLPEELAILTGSPGGFVRSGELWRPEACPEACVYSRRSMQYLLEARGALFAPESCGARKRVCVLPEELAILTGSPGALFAPESCGARRRARRRVCTPGGACDTYWKPGGLCSLRRAVAPGGVPGGVCVLPEELAILTGSPGGFVRSGELWRPEACPEACPEAVYSRRSLQYLLEARGLCSLRRAVAPGGVPGGVCVLPEELAILTGSPGGFVRSGELWRPEACVCTPGGACEYLLEARGALFAPESCGARRRARRRVCTPGGACDTYWKPGGLCSLRRAVAPGGVPGGVCVLPEELAILTGARGALFAPESCGARRRARRRVCTPGGACNTYWKPGGLCSLRRAVRPEACPEACVYSRRSLRYLLEARGALFAPESCGARRRARRRVCRYSRRNL